MVNSFEASELSEKLSELCEQLKIRDKIQSVYQYSSSRTT